MKPKIGLFAGGIEVYWVVLGMDELPSRIAQDANRLADYLDADVLVPNVSGNPTDAAACGKAIREAECDLAIVYHATFVDDDMSVAFLNALGNDIPVLQLHSQGVHGIPEDISLIDYGTCYGNNSAVQVMTTLRRMHRQMQLPLLAGALDDPKFHAEIAGWARAAKAVKGLRGAQIHVLPHWVTSFGLWDTLPDPVTLMSQTGIKIEFRYVDEVKDRMDAMADAAVNDLVDEIYEKYEVMEPPRDEVVRSARGALALEQLCKDYNIDALAIEPFRHYAEVTGTMPALALDRLADKGIVVTIEGDVAIALAGLIMKGLTGDTGHFFEHLMFDVEKNWILGGHDGGSAGFNKANPAHKVKLRNTMYVDFKKTDFDFETGVIPEFITKPGPITMLSLCPMIDNGNKYAMRIVTGEAVDTTPRSICMEHTIFKPDMPVEDYYPRVAELGCIHHFALFHHDLRDDLHKVARLLDMDVDDVCPR